MAGKPHGAESGEADSPIQGSPTCEKGEWVLTEWCRGWGLPPPAELLSLSPGVAPRRVTGGEAWWCCRVEHPLRDLLNCRELDKTPAAAFSVEGPRSGVGLVGSGSPATGLFAWVGSSEAGLLTSGAHRRRRKPHGHASPRSCRWWCDGGDQVLGPNGLDGSKHPLPAWIFPLMQ